MTMRKGLFIAATGQNVGKTTLCLGLIASLQKKVSSLGFMKPVGQQHVITEDNTRVDKDVVLFKEHFHLPYPYKQMSPVIFPRGFTRDFLDGKVQTRVLEEAILESFSIFQKTCSFTLVEGTGHVGVGSIVDLNNAKVASLLGLDMVLIVKGGLGSAIDELSLNKALCDHYGVRIAGVILNRVLESKREMLIPYVEKALSKWKIPLVGAIPYNICLNTPTMFDFAQLFDTHLIAGERYGNLHFSQYRLIATSVATFKELSSQNNLLVTPATREDILHALIEIHPEGPPQQGLILTGRYAPTSEIVQILKTLEIPTLYAPMPTYEVMKKMHSFTAKIRVQDKEKILKAISLVESHLDFEKLF